ncbi:CBS domain-containing protein [Bradyrhizobium sp. CCBAU 51753]|uniref:CBS domain-containing protein n=1 Tax=Bradyrhizobium sp. CCBAU 51753 TaxID=1325100 RepID=UPI00188A9794|nr:CBS domain-containing protein [Bradyrhizobium sp. CCBAU 51753]QOZ28516.1 histidine kinase [Bradyrhizobium sp. CCBAU 51753]
MQARDVMVCSVISVGPDIPVQIAANAMVRNCVSALPVIDIYAKLVGIVSEGDLIRRVEIGTDRHPSGVGEALMSSDALAADFVRSHAKRVSDVMTREVVTAQPETPLPEIVNLMEKHNIKRVPIVQGEQVVGIVSRANLLQVLARANDDTDWVESDRALHQRFVESIKNQPWASRPFNIIVKDRRADLWGFVHSVDEKTAVRVAAEATPGIESVSDHLGIAPQGSET